MLCEDKLPESTGDKLTAWGDGFQLSWGSWIGLSWGSIELYWLCSSMEPTLIPWRTEQSDCLDNPLLPLFLMWERKMPVEVLDDCRFDQPSSGRQVTR